MPNNQRLWQQRLQLQAAERVLRAGREASAMGRDLANYTGVGAAATAVHYLVLVGAVEQLRWPAWEAALCGAVVGALIAYLGNHRLTFRSNRAHRSAFSRFALVALAGAGMQSALVALGTQLLHLHYLLAQGVATGFALLTTFVVNRRWTFLRAT